MRRILKLSLLWALLLSAVFGKETAEDYQSRLQSLFQEAFDNQGEAKAAYIGLYDPLLDQDFYFAIGNASSSTPGGSPPDLPATTQDHFDIGSITKTFTGTIVLLLAQEGVLSLNDTIAMVVPEFATEFPRYADYTIQQLLKMETTVPDFEYSTNQLLMGDPTKRYENIEDIVAVALEKEPVPIGYSSTNYIVLDLIVQVLTNTTLEQHFQDRIYAPLDMENTFLPPMDGDGFRPEPASIPYAGPECSVNLQFVYNFSDVKAGDDIDEISRSVVLAGAAGSMVSNLRDLLTWAKSGLGDSLLSEESVANRHNYSTPILPYLYGIAQLIYSSDEIEQQAPGLDHWKGWYGHPGGTYGFLSMCYLNDDLNGAAFVSALNTCAGEVEEEFLRIFTNDLKDRMEVPTASNSTTTPETEASDSSSESTEVGNATSAPVQTGESEGTPLPDSSANQQFSAKRFSFGLFVLMGLL